MNDEVRRKGNFVV
uniref:Uncharacterized protein n=1 Tax=Arundo donax TaxID=35708 RepID=A0A0A9BSH3_ARUDO